MPPLHQLRATDFQKKIDRLLFATPDTEAAIFQTEPCTIYSQMPYSRAQKPPGGLVNGGYTVRNKQRVLKATAQKEHTTTPTATASKQKITRRPKKKKKIITKKGL